MIKLTIKGRWFLVSAFIWMGCLFAVQALAASEMAAGISTGKQQIVNDDISRAKQNAISDALATAVHNAYVSLVSRDMLARNLGFIYDTILVDTSHYIANYKVLAEQRQNNYYLVAVESRVDMSRLEKILSENNLIHTNREIPTLLLLISEKTGGEVLPRYWWGNNPLPYESIAEEVLIGLMEKYQVLSAAGKRYRPEPSFYNIVFQSVYDVNAAIELGAQMKADLVAIGSARSMKAPNRMGEEKTYMATIELDVYHTGTKEKVVSTRIQETVASQETISGNRDALTKVAHAAGEDIMPRINQFWKDYLKEERAIIVTIQGDDFIPRFVSLKQKFREMPEIENVVPREIGTRTAQVEVFYKGKAKQFANDLVLKTFDSFGIEISDLTDTSLTIQFVEEGMSGPPENTDPAGNMNDSENTDG